MDPQGPEVFRVLNRELGHPPSSDAEGTGRPSLGAVVPSRDVRKEVEEEEMRAAYSSASVSTGY